MSENGEQALLNFVMQAHQRITAMEGLILLLIRASPRREDLIEIIADLAKAQAKNEDTRASSAIYFELLGHMSAIEGF